MKCRMCSKDAKDELLIGTTTALYDTMPLCDAHLAAMRLNEWWLTIRLMDHVGTVRGKSLDNAFNDKPDL